MLTSLTPGTPIIYDGNKVVYVSETLAADFVEGDRIVVVQSTGDILHIPLGAFQQATIAVDAAYDAFQAMGNVTDQQVSAFYEAFADRLEDSDSFAAISEANNQDVAAARAKGRSTTRLVLSEVMRSDMVAGYR